MDATRTMVFVNTKRTAEDVHAYLESNGYPAAMLSGDVPQKKRLRFLSQFEQGEIPILVATDVAARGLHIPGVTHVISFDLPQDAEDYVHRIGRPVPSAMAFPSLLADISAPAHVIHRHAGPARRGGQRSSSGPRRTGVAVY